MKSWPAGLIVRFFNVTIPTYTGRIGKSTGNAFIEKRLPLKRREDAERTAKELRRVAAGALDIGVRVEVRASDNPPDAGIVIDLDRREWGERLGQLCDGFGRAAEIVDDDDGTLARAKTQEMRLHACAS